MPYFLALAIAGKHLIVGGVMVEATDPDDAVIVAGCRFLAETQVPIDRPDNLLIVPTETDAKPPPTLIGVVLASQDLMEKLPHFVRDWIYRALGYPDGLLPFAEACGVLASVQDGTGDFSPVELRAFRSISEAHIRGDIDSGDALAALGDALNHYRGLVAS